MPSRQEQLQSYQFMVQRVVSALVLRETDPPQSPFRRAVGAAFASVLVTVIIAAGFGVYSIFTGGGNQQWRKAGAVIIEKDTSAVFVFRNGKLHPALNFTSAMLASEAAKPPVFRVSAKSLQDVPWGETIGIRDVPNTLVGKKSLAGFPWSVCTVSGANNAAPLSTVMVGEATGASVGDGEAFLVKSSTRSAEQYLLWMGRLYQLVGSDTGGLAAGVQATIVSPGFIKGLPRGRDLQKVNTGVNTGKPSKFDQALLKIGDVIAVTGAAEERYVIVLEDRLAYISQMQALLSGQLGARQETLSALTKGGQIQIAQDVELKGDALHPIPEKVPAIKTYTGTGFCSVIRDKQGNAELRKDILVNLEQRPPTARRSGDRAVYADYVFVPNGKGAVVLSGQTYSYVSRDGVRYAMASSAVKDKLGFDGVTPLELPPQLVALLPEGPGLDPVEAMVPVTIS